MLHTAVPKNWRKSSTVFEALGHAWRGIVYGLKIERNLRLQAVIFVVVLAASLFLRLSALALAVIVAVASLVLALEMINTAFELLSNIVQRRFHDRVRAVKDLAAGAVLLASVLAAVAGMLILGPAAVDLFLRT